MPQQLSLSDELFSAGLPDSPDQGTVLNTEDVPVINIERYADAIGPIHTAFKAVPSFGNALLLSKAILNAAINHSSPDAELAVSCSWGKDSTAVVGVLASVLLQRRDLGLRIPPVLIVTADTRNEFPDMQVRVAEEMKAIEAWGAREGIPIRTAVTQPAAKNTLYAEVIGAGRPLPTYQKKNKADRSSWCVARLKSGPINRSILLAKSSGHKVIHLLGTRLDESERRRHSMTFYGHGLPEGLTRTSDVRAKPNDESLDPDRIGVTPIGHWTHEHLTVFLRVDMAPWNPWSYEALKTIYRRGSLEADENGTGECRITFTADGGVSNVCSDLSGSRFGCMTCVVSSSNRSLQAYAQRDPRYVWIRRVHRYLVAGMGHHRRRMRDLRQHGFNERTCFPKNHTFEWRYRLAMLVCRAEIESGFTLLEPDVVQAIDAWWQRSGVFTVTMADARADALRWKETGQFRMRWKTDASQLSGLSPALSAGVCGNIYAHMLHDETGATMEPVSRANLLPLAGRISQFYPRPLAYVFRDPFRSGFLTVLTDTPGDIGRRLNTETASGSEVFSLELIHTRDLTQWERVLMRGRMVFYRHSLTGVTSAIEQIKARGPNDLEALRAAKNLREMLLANVEASHDCRDNLLAEEWTQSSLIHALRGLGAADFERVTKKVDRALMLSLPLTDAHESVISQVKAAHKTLLQKCRGNAFGGDPEARAILVSAISRLWSLETDLPMFLEYIDAMRDLASEVAGGFANVELINRLCYILQTQLYDERYAQSLLIDLMRLLQVQHSSQAA